MADRYDLVQDKLPSSYRDFIESQGGWEGDLGDQLGYVIIWDRDSIQDRWESYEMAKYLGDRWFPFGSDGGGEMLCFDLASGSDRIFWMPYIGMGDNDAMAQPFAFADMAAAIRKSLDASNP